MLTEVAIGAVIHNDALVIAIREGDQLELPIQHTLRNALEGVVLLLGERFRLRHDDPVIFLEANGTAGAVLDGIRKKDSRSRDQIIHGLAAAISGAGAGVEFYDRRSELHHRFHERVAQGKLVVPAAYNEQLAAFGSEVKDGKVFYPHVTDVAAKLGRFPSLAVAAVLAAIDVSPRRATRRNHDPYAAEFLARP